MSVEKVREYLKQFGVADKIEEFDTSSATVELAAKALGCEPERIAKSIACETENESVLIVTAGDTKLDNAKYKAQFSTKAKMIPPQEVEEKVGHAVGGVCPFAINKRVAVYLDNSLKRFDKVYPACGSSNSAIGLSIDELVQCSNSIGWVDVCKIKE